MNFTLKMHSVGESFSRDFNQREAACEEIFNITQEVNVE